MAGMNALEFPGIPNGNDWKTVTNKALAVNLKQVCSTAIFLLAILGMPGQLLAQADKLEVSVISGRPDMVSGESALIQITVPENTSLKSVAITVNSKDETSAFHSDPNRHALLGLVRGLDLGRNTVSASIVQGSTTQGPASSLILTDHPITGPVISGPKETPFVCETEGFKLPYGGTLGKPLDNNCSVKTVVQYLYHRKDDKELTPLSDLSAIPTDAEMLTGRNGVEVPFVVRIETGTIDRGIYQISMLANPVTAGRAEEGFARSAAWNGRLIYLLGGGCINGWYRQGQNSNEFRGFELLRQGYATATSTLNTFGNNCDDVLATESLMMVKEHFVKTYGLPLLTIGLGCSGGSEQAQPMSQNYPGLLDGIVVGCSFPDLMSDLAVVATDTRLITSYFAASGLSYSPTAKLAIAGFRNEQSMIHNADLAGRIKVDEYCPAVLPQALRYNAASNRQAARCDIYDHAVNALGRDPATGFALRPLDNVGVQYGLKALNDKSISKDQFLDLNEKVGGYDSDGNVTRERSNASLSALRAAYQSGRVLSGGGNFGRTPIIDYRAYADDNPAGDAHLRFHSFATRARLQKANGYHDNQVMLIEEEKQPGGLFPMTSPVLLHAITQMDQWLTGLAKDPGGVSPIELLRRNKPADLVDACWTRGPSPKKIAEELSFDSGECARLYPPALSPRLIAGAPIAGDILKCQLKPVDKTDYKVAFTPAEWQRLKAIFPAGVCDWSKSGVGQQPPTKTWQTFGADSSALSANRLSAHK
jgi:hypothetical protein